jgi:hypothetical protein
MCIPRKIEPWTSATPLGLSASLLLFAIAGVGAQERSLSLEERLAIERWQNEVAVARNRAHRLDRLRVLQCMEQPGALLGLDHGAVEDQCGPSTLGRRVTADGRMSPDGKGNTELVYMERDGTLLLTVVLETKFTGRSYTTSVVRVRVRE